MSEMIEKVAKAIRGRRIDLAGHIQANPLDPANGFEMALARAAIGAMREPTEAMRFAGIINNFGNYADVAYQAMIDEAVSGPTSSDGGVEGHAPEGSATASVRGQRERRPRDMEAAGSQREAETGRSPEMARVREQASNCTSQDSDRIAGPSAARGRAGVEPGPSEAITMSDIRLMAGEGKLSAHDVLNAANAVLRMRSRQMAQR